VKVFLPIIWNDLSRCVLRAFRDQGCETLVFDRQAHSSLLAREELERELIDWARSFGPQLAFCQFQAPGVISSAFPSALREINCFNVNWCGDVREPLPQWYLDVAPYFNVTAFSNWQDVLTLRAAGHRAEFLQIGIDEHLYTPMGSPHGRKGVVFIGNNWLNYYPEGKNRIRMVQALAAALGGEFQVYGQGWAGLVPNRSHGGEIEQPADADVYRAAKVAVGWEHFRRAGFASDRLLRATACGCRVIQSHYEGIEADHPHVDAVETVEEVVLATRAALAAGDASIGTRNARHTLTHHTWSQRVEQIMAWMH
jgi:hypothetical protein